VPSSAAAPASAAMYSRPRCACLACSDLSPTTGDDDVDRVYRHPTWRHNDDNYNDDDDVYYNNSNDVDVGRPSRAGCSCFGGGTVPVSPAAVVGQHGRPLRHGNPPSTLCMY